MHLLVEIHPALNISTLINNLKTASARRARTRFASTSNLFIGNRFFCIALIMLAASEVPYWRQCDVTGKATGPRKNRARPSGPLDPLLAYGPRRGMRGRMFNL
ncbi:transposase [Acidithiobacillus ferriphilus]|uniref:transposase n=1 Tax=Acidithiobacillus ferriphilus TaxID=1689834 RepID=UPI001C079F8D|nr:hypothetical protein [Acidithiobacillus ferriphilus]